MSTTVKFSRGAPVKKLSLSFNDLALGESVYVKFVGVEINPDGTSATLEARVAEGGKIETIDCPLDVADQLIGNVEQHEWIEVEKTRNAKGRGKALYTVYRAIKQD